MLRLAGSQGGCPPRTRPQPPCLLLRSDYGGAAVVLHICGGSGGGGDGGGGCGEGGCRSGCGGCMGGHRRGCLVGLVESSGGERSLDARHLTRHEAGLLAWQLRQRMAGAALTPS